MALSKDKSKTSRLTVLFNYNAAVNFFAKSKNNKNRKLKAHSIRFVNRVCFRFFIN